MKIVKIVALSSAGLMALGAVGGWYLFHAPSDPVLARYSREHAATKRMARPCVAAELGGRKSAEERSRARALCLEAANAGDPLAQLILGDLWERDSATEATRWYRASATQKFEPAMRVLALDYMKGHGVLQDSVRAAQLMEAAARRNYPLAQAQMAQWYGLGRGVPQSNVRALSWMEIASRQDALLGDERENFERFARWIKSTATPEELVEAHRQAEAFQPE